VFPDVGTTVGDGGAVTCIQPETRTDPVNAMVALAASRAEATEGVSALPNTSKPSATLPAMVWRTGPTPIRNDTPVTTNYLPDWTLRYAAEQTRSYQSPAP
jgi:hypothetical protein